MANYKTVVGVGQVGSRLASLYANKNDILLTFNTDHRDSGGIKLGNDHLVVNGGAGQNYSRGLKIWAENREKLERYLEPVENQDVVYFVAGGGGSGSSSVITFLNILLKQNNRILLVVTTPFLKESIPATSNATRLLSRVNEFSNNMSVYIASNDEISKEINHSSFEKVNQRIIEKVKHITDLPNFHHDDSYTPFAIDEGDHTSVAFSGGFINISYDDLEREMEETGRPKMPKFSYGKIQEASNVLVTKLIHNKHNNETVQIEGDKLVEVIMKVGNSAKSARTLYGIIRPEDKKMPLYITLASGLSIDKVFDKLKGKATDFALRHSEKIKTKTSKKLERQEDKILDV
ncbi:MAG: hypothetical protein ACOC3V_02590 [bacterium]